MKKKKLLQEILKALRGEVELFYKAARASHEEATHEQNKAENKYDTRGLEAAYLAGGQARQAAEAELALKMFEALPIRDFTDKDSIEVGALVRLQTPDGENVYFLGPRAGGLEIKMGKTEVLVLTPQSPLGNQLVGKRALEKFVFKNGNLSQKCQVLSVS